MNKGTWMCDTCGGVIEKAGDGWVEWLSPVGKDRTGRGEGLRIVHHKPASPYAPEGRCQYDQHEEFKRGFILSDMQLDHFLGANGLMVLLSLLAEGELPKEQVLEMVKRLHIPGYEQARPHFEAAMAEGAFEPNLPPGFYSQGQIEATLDYAKEQGAD